MYSTYSKDSFSALSILKAFLQYQNHVVHIVPGDVYSAQRSLLGHPLCNSIDGTFGTHSTPAEKKIFFDCEPTTRVNITRINIKLIVPRYNQPIEYLPSTYPYQLTRFRHIPDRKGSLPKLERERERDLKPLSLLFRDTNLFATIVFFKD